MSGPGIRTAAARLACAGALLAAAPAAAATLEVTLEPRTATVGDRVEAVLVLAAAAGELAGDPRFPVWGERWGAAEIVEAGPVERRGGEHRQRLILAAYRPGSLELPPKRVAVPGPAGTAELWTPADLVLQVDSVLPAGDEGEAVEPRPPVPPRALPLGAAFWWTAAALGLLAAGAAALAVRRHRPAAGSPARRLAPAAELEKAFRSILEGAGRDAAPEEGHVVLSLALRRYLGRSFGFPAAESTTSEVRRELRGRRVPATVETRSDELLRACDRVKFAREPVARSTLEARIEAAREIAGQVEAHLAPPAPEAAPGRTRKEAA